MASVSMTVCVTERQAKLSLQRVSVSRFVNRELFNGVVSDI